MNVEFSMIRSKFVMLICFPEKRKKLTREQRRVDILKLTGLTGSGLKMAFFDVTELQEREKEKRTRVLEEENIAMKDQLHLQEREMESLREELKTLKDVHLKNEDDYSGQMKRLHDRSLHLMDNLDMVNRRNEQLEEHLTGYKEENEAIMKKYQSIENELFTSKQQLSILTNKAIDCQQLKEDNKRLNKELIDIVEMYQKASEKLSSCSSNHYKNLAAQEERRLTLETAYNEIKNLKSNLDNKTIQLDYFRSQSETFKSQISQKDLKLTELKQHLENERSQYRTQLQVSIDLFNYH